MSFGWNWKTGRNSVLRKGSLKMEKNFLDVFPNLEMGQELAALLEEVMEGRLPNHRAELMAELDRLAGRKR